MNYSSNLLTLIDIGALGGLENPWKSNFCHRVIQFEPNADQTVQAALGQNGHIKYNCALAAARGTQQLRIFGESGSGSSILEQNHDWVRQNFQSIKNLGNSKLNSTWLERSQLLEVQSILTDTLDHVCENHQISPDYPCFVKCDTQGYESEVLKGAEKILDNGSCVGLELELYRFPLYKGIVLEAEIIAFLFDKGFELAGWTGYKNSFNSQADYLFLKCDSNLTPSQRDIVGEIKALYSPYGVQGIIKHNYLQSIIRTCKDFVGY
jgi:FkbM family methyltransferase